MRKVSEGVVVRVKVVPKSSKNQIMGFQDSILRVKLNAVPEKGKANAELISFLSECFEIPKSYIKILKGETSSNKEIFFNIDQDTLVRFIQKQLKEKK